MHSMDGFAGGDSKPCIWREVSVEGGIYALRESRSTPQKSSLVCMSRSLLKVLSPSPKSSVKNYYYCSSYCLYEASISASTSTGPSRSSSDLTNGNTRDRADCRMQFNVYAQDWYSFDRVKVKKHSQFMLPICIQDVFLRGCILYLIKNITFVVTNMILIASTIFFTIMFLYWEIIWFSRMTFVLWHALYFRRMSNDVGTDGK